LALTYFKTSIGGYFFDVTFNENYTFENQITPHPVQSGANINDHVYQQPVQISFDIGMSDCLKSYKTGQFTGASSRSAAAFQILYKLWKNATPLEIDSNINGSVIKYYNMLVKNIAVTKDKTTHNAIKATVSLQQIIVTNAVSVSVVSANSQVTDSSGTGSKYAIPSAANTVGGRTIGQGLKDILGG